MGGQRIKQQVSHISHLYTHTKTSLHSVSYLYDNSSTSPIPDSSASYQRKLNYMEGKRNVNLNA